MAAVQSPTAIHCMRRRRGDFSWTTFLLVALFWPSMPGACAFANMSTHHGNQMQGRLGIEITEKALLNNFSCFLAELKIIVAQICYSDTSVPTAFVDVVRTDRHERPAPGERIIDAHGQVLAHSRVSHGRRDMTGPGWIDSDLHPTVPSLKALL